MIFWAWQIIVMSNCSTYDGIYLLLVFYGVLCQTRRDWIFSANLHTRALYSVSKVLCCKSYYWVEFVTRLHRVTLKSDGTTGRTTGQ